MGGDAAGVEPDCPKDGVDAAAACPNAAADPDCPKDGTGDAVV